MHHPNPPGEVNDNNVAAGTNYPAAFGSAESFFAALSSSLGAMIAFIDADERIVYANRMFAGWLGLSPAQIAGRSLLEVYGADAHAAFLPYMRRALGGETVRYERELHKPGASAAWISVDLRPHRDANGQILGVFASSLEVDELKRTHDALDKALQVQAFHMDNSPLAVIEWSANIEVQRWSGQAEAIFGWRADEVVGRRSNEIGLVHPDWRPTIRASTVELLEGRVRRNRMIARNLTRSGRYIFCEWFNSAFIDSDGKTQGILSLAQDVTLRIEAEEQLRYSAVHDTLTGLQNRQSLMTRLEHALARVRRSGEPLALMFIDLDKFKDVNDTHGHAVGDEFLKQVAARLMSCVRSADTVARIGGDEFVVLLDANLEPDTPELIRQRIVDGFKQGFTVGGHFFESSASIGTSRFPDDGNDPDHLLASADRAMYRAKRSS
ncbi:MAG: diguanylate cyclase [Betaproteobacteria bacterium]